MLRTLTNMIESQLYIIYWNSDDYFNAVYFSQMLGISNNPFMFINNVLPLDLSMLISAQIGHEF